MVQPRCVALLAATAGLATAQPAWGESAPGAILQPSSDWILDYGLERCTLIRDFGDGDEEFTLRVDSFGSWHDFRFTLVGSRIPESRTLSSDNFIRFTPDAEDRPKPMLHGTAGERPAVFFGAMFAPASSDDLDPEAPPTTAELLADASLTRFEADTESLSIQFHDKSRVKLKFGKMGAPLRAMRACVDDLHSYWGLDPGVERTLSRRARPKNRTVRRVQERYPGDMLATGTNAYVPVRVMVDARGEVEACVVQSESVQEAFRRTVCQGLSRGYEPALDQSGQPTASVSNTMVLYRIGQ